MILESLIQNEMRVCLDCAKATLVKGSKITIADEYYQHRDVQGAIKAGFCKLVGDPPAGFAEKTKEKTKKLKNIWKSKIALDCIKGTVEVGGVIDVPESALAYKEIQNALAWGMLCDPDAPMPIVDVGSTKAAKIEEVKVSHTAPKAGKKSKKAKPISRVGEEGETEEKEEESLLYKESKVIDPSATKNNKMFDAPPTEKKKAEEPDRFDFLSIFGDEEKK
jgi:hypothetical protein